MSDTLSEVLRAVRLSGAVFFTIDATAPWVVEAQSSKVVAPHVLPRAEHVIEYHVVKSGSCFGGLVGGRSLRLEAGDVVAFPHGDPHILASAPGMRGGPGPEGLQGIEEAELPIQMTLHGGGEPAEIICGFIGCNARPFEPLLSALPRVLHARPQGPEDAVFRNLVDLAVTESTMRRSGSASFLSHVSELLFSELVRKYLASLPQDRLGWLAGLRDETVGRALTLLHQRPAHPWSLEELAREVAVSRTLLADRFAHFVGVPPIHYLAEWRIQLAASLLRSTESSLAEIADRVGYGSEASLSRAFKRSTGIAPAAYRRRAA